MDADAIDLSKENIQPLRQGRKTAQLGLALKAQDDKDVYEKMLKERDSYELAIITYEGDDPLGPRHDYVIWIEQCCPKYGPESNMIPLLEDTIILFKDDERYKQDPRFIELIIKYIETQDNAPELYQIVHGQGVGTKCALLYKAWAECLDSCLNFKGTDQIFRLGIASNAEPVELLKELHTQFQLSVARRMLIGGEGCSTCPSDTGVTERQRTVLGKIGKLSAAGSLRPTRGGAGPVNALFSDSKNNVKINVYQENENDDILLKGTQNYKIGSFANTELIHKENAMKAQPWNQGFSKKSHRSVAAPARLIPSTPTFQVLRDDDSDDDLNKEMIEQPHPTPVTASKVLKTRKADLVQKTPIQLFKSPHVGSARNNMPKFEVYSGGREFSFEELRLAYYKKHEFKTADNYTILQIKDSSDSYDLIKTPLTSISKLPNNLHQLALVDEEEEEEEDEDYAVSIDSAKTIQEMQSNTGLIDIKENNACTSTLKNDEQIDQDQQNDKNISNQEEDQGEIDIENNQNEEKSNIKLQEPVIIKSLNSISSQVSLKDNSKHRSVPSKSVKKKKAAFRVYCD